MKHVTRILFIFLLLCIVSASYAQEDVSVSLNERPKSGWTALFRGKHIEAPFGVTVGYVNKEWSTDFGNRVYHENMWGQENKRLHGLQLGIVAQPCFQFGLGIHAGLFYEWYYSVSQVVLDAGYDNFTENNFYIPVHAMYRIPFTRNMSFSIFGGIGLNWAFKGSYNEEYRYYRWDGSYDKNNDVVKWQEYGKKGEWPKRLNIQWEIGATFRYSLVQLSFTYSRGLTNHNFYEGYKTKQNKLAFTLAILLEKND